MGEEWWVLEGTLSCWVLVPKCASCGLEGGVVGDALFGVLLVIIDALRIGTYVEGESYRVGWHSLIVEYSLVKSSGLKGGCWFAFPTVGID